MRRAVLASLLAAAALGGCNRSATPPRQADAAPRAPATAQAPSLYFEPEASEPDLGDLETLRFVGMDEGPVPEFHVRAVHGEVFDSQALVGKRPFVVVFFATWCGVCNLKMPAISAALGRLGRLVVIGVSVDGPETWPQVSRFLRRHDLEIPIVRAAEHPRFAVSYNPFSGIPAVVVVGRNGGLVDLQMGYSPDDGERLIAAVRLARTIGPLRRSTQ